MIFHALIPARKGSKGIKNKNMHEFLGLPLIEHTLRSAQKSKYLNSITVSSNDKNLLDFVSGFDINILKRPEEISLDESRSDEVVSHFIDCSPLDIHEDDYIVFLQPTSPFRTNKEIDRAIIEVKNNNYESLIGVAETLKSPFKTFKIKNGKLFSVFSESFLNSPRQKLEKTFYPNGAIYIFKVKLFKRLNGFPNNESFPFIMDHFQSTDIDTKADLDYAKWLHENMYNNQT